MSKKIKILEVYYEPGISGITRHVGMFTEVLKNTDFDFHILYSSNDEMISDYYKSNDIPVQSVPGAKYFSFRGLKQIHNNCREFNIQIVHIHNLQSMFWAGLAKCFNPGVSFCFTPHVISFENKIIEKIFFF